MNFSKVLNFFRWMVGLLFIGLAVFFTYVLMFDPANQTPELAEKRVIIDGSVIKGYEKNVLSWLLKARNMWVGDYEYLVFLTDAYDGQVFDNAKDTVLKIDYAKSMKVNYRTKSIYAEDIKVSLLGNRGPETDGLYASPNATTRNIQISATSFKYYSRFKKAFLSGDVEIHRGDSIMKVNKEIEVDIYFPLFLSLLNSFFWTFSWQNVFILFFVLISLILPAKISCKLYIYLRNFNYNYS